MDNLTLLKYEGVLDTASDAYRARNGKSATSAEELFNSQLEFGEKAFFTSIDCADGAMDGSINSSNFFLHDEDIFFENSNGEYITYDVKTGKVKQLSNEEMAQVFDMIDDGEMNGSVSQDDSIDLTHNGWQIREDSEEQDNGSDVDSVDNSVDKPDDDSEINPDLIEESLTNANDRLTNTANNDLLANLVVGGDYSNVPKEYLTNSLNDMMNLYNLAVEAGIDKNDPRMAALLEGIDKCTDVLVDGTYDTHFDKRKRTSSEILNAGSTALNENKIEGHDYNHDDINSKYEYDNKDFYYNGISNKQPIEAVKPSDDIVEVMNTELFNSNNLTYHQESKDLPFDPSLHEFDSIESFYDNLDQNNDGYISDEDIVNAARAMREKYGPSFPFINNGYTVMIDGKPYQVKYKLSNNGNSAKINVKPAAGFIHHKLINLDTNPHGLSGFFQNANNRNYERPEEKDPNDFLNNLNNFNII